MHKDKPQACWRTEREIKLADLATTTPLYTATASQSLSPTQPEQLTFIPSIQQEHPFVTLSPAQPRTYSSTPIQAVATSSSVQPLSYSSLPIQAAARSPPAQLRTYSSLPIQQGHPATQLSTPENLEHAVITSSPEQLPCSTPFSSQQPPFTAPALPATDSNCLLQQTFITNQVLLTVLTKGPNYNADDTNGNGIEQYPGGG